MRAEANPVVDRLTIGRILHEILKTGQEGNLANVITYRRRMENSLIHRGRLWTRLL